MSWNQRLKRLVSEQGLTMRELSRRSGVPYDNVNKYLRGDVAQPRGDTMTKLAEALGTTALFLQTGLTDPKLLSTRAVPFRGEVAAGVWTEVGDGIDSPDEWLPFNPVPQFPEGSVYALTVRGNSLDRIAPPGTVLVCVDLVSTGLDIREGDLVIVERAKHQGGLLEMTAKRVRAVAGGFELYPESSDPKWQPVKFPHAKKAEGETIRVLARVEYILKRP